MSLSNDLNIIFDRIQQGIHTDADLAHLRQFITVESGTVQYVSQDGKFNTNIGTFEGEILHIGDVYQGSDVATLKQVLQELLANTPTDQSQPQPPAITGEQLRTKVLDFLGAIQNRCGIERIFENASIHSDNAYVPIQVTLTPQEHALQTVIKHIASGKPTKQDILFFLEACQKECISLPAKTPDESEGYLNRLIQAFEQDGDLEQLVTAVQASMMPVKDQVKIENHQISVDWSTISQLHHQHGLYQRIMLLGEPGMGKSTLLRVETGLAATHEIERLTNTDNQIGVDDIVLPIFLKFSDLICPSQELITHIPKLILRNENCTAEEIFPWIQSKLKSGQCILFIDSLDEFPKDKGNYQELKQKLERFLDNYPCPLICTSRIVGYEGNFLPGCQDLKILPFEPSKIEHYIHTWLDNTDATALMREFYDNPQVFGLAENPLLLSLICKLYRTEGIDLLSSRAKIYKKAVKHMLTDWRQGRRTSQSSEEQWDDTKLEILEKLAYEFSCHGDTFQQRKLRKTLRTIISSDDFADVSKNISAEALVDEFSEHIGILQKRDREEYTFIHRTFREYLTACYLAENDDGVELARQHFWNYNWHETISLTAGLMSDPTPLLQAIMTGKDDIFKTQLLLAGQCIAECKENNHPLVREIIDKICLFWEGFGETPLELEFIQPVVVSIGKSQPYLFEKLINNLRYPTPDKPKPGVPDLGLGPTSVRQTLEVLGRIGNSAAVPYILDTIVEPGEGPWRYASDALETIGTPIALEALLNKYNGDKYVGRRRRRAWRALNTERLRTIILDKDSLDPANRREGVWIFGDRKAPNALSTLTKILRDETEDIRVRGQAAVGLGRLGDVTACEVLAPFVSEEEEIADSVVWALDRLRHPNALKALLTALKDSRETIARKAAQALGALGDAGAVESLISVLANDQHPAIAQAIDALAKIGDSQAIKPLAQLVNNSQFQWSIVTALGKIGTPEAVSILKELLHQVNNQTQAYHIAIALVQIGTPDAFQVLLPWLKVSNPNELRASIAASLHEVDDLAVNKVLAEYADDADKEVKKWAIDALLKIDEKQGVKALIAALQEPDMRTWAGESLGGQTSQYVVSELIAILQNYNCAPETRAWAALDLGAIGNAQAIDPLIAALSDRNNHLRIRSQASKALSKFNTYRVVQAMETILDRGDDEIATRVAYDLADMGQDKAIETLVNKIKDFESSNEKNRRSAIDSLTKLHSVRAIEVLTDLLEHPDSEVVSQTVRVLGEYGTEATLRKLVESPEIDIMSPQFFHLARTLAIRFANLNRPFIPVYPDKIQHKISS